MSLYYFIEKNVNWEENAIATATNFISKTNRANIFYMIFLSFCCKLC